MKILLDDADMDAQLSRSLIAVSAEAADLGEVFTTAARVVEGDYDSWLTEWSAIIAFGVSIPLAFPAPHEATYVWFLAAILPQVSRLRERRGGPGAAVT